MPRYSYRDSYGTERVIDAPSLGAARQRILEVESRRSGSLAAGNVAAHSAVAFDVPRTDDPAPAVLGAAPEPSDIEPSGQSAETRRSRATVVFDLEANDAPVPLGVYVRSDDDSVVYRTPNGSVRFAPADCVAVREVDVYAPPAPFNPFSAQALQAVAIVSDEPEPIGGPIASYAEVAALRAAIAALDAIEKRAGAQQWRAPREVSAAEPSGFALGRCAEACDRAEWGIENALTTMEVYAHNRAAKALTKAREQAAEASDDA
jgi:hypothetical protein